MAIRQKLLFGLLAVITTIGSGASSALAQGGPGMIPLSATQSGELPDGFSMARTGKGAAPEWRVVDDATVPGRRVLAQTSADQTDYRFPLAIYQPVSAANLEVTVRIKAVSGEVDRAGGIAIRLADADNYYVVRANALEDNVNFYRVVKGRRSEVHGAHIKVTSNAWHTLGLRSEGDRFTVSFDGKSLFTATGRTFPEAGKVALWTKADSVTYFDALTVHALP